MDNHREDQEQRPELSIVIVNYNGMPYLGNCLDSLEKNIKHISYEVIVVDNASSDSSVEEVRRRYSAVKVIELGSNMGYAKANNEGVKWAKGPLTLVLNNDTVVPAGAVETLVFAKRSNPQYGVVAPVLLHLDNSFQLSFGKDLNLITEFFLKYAAGKWYRMWFYLKKRRMDKDVDWVSGACFLMEKSLYDRLGGFDERFFMYLEDADLGRRVRQLGYKIHVTSDSQVFHVLGQTTSKYASQVLLGAKKSQLHYYCKHNSLTAFWILKFYLLARFRVKYVFALLRGDSHHCEVFRRVSQIIREFSCEDHS